MCARCLLFCSSRSFMSFLLFLPLLSSLFFFFNDPATTEIYTLSLHDALPICPDPALAEDDVWIAARQHVFRRQEPLLDRKSTRLNSSHLGISYAVFCLKKKKNNKEY